jgi:peptidoglycan hydrolase-like amidase
LPPAVPAEPVLVRVGLETDQAEVRVPCCRGELFLAAGGRRFRVHGALRVQPDAESTGVGFYRLQVAALRDEEQAWGLARRLGQELGQDADALFDAGVGLYRVRVGRYRDRPAAEQARTVLAARGMASSWIVSEGATVGEAAFQVIPPQDGTAVAPLVLAGRWLALESSAGVVAWGQRTYRGRLLLYVNDRGSMNVINEIALEDYLRSVVPSEMGPELYDRLEALKAQAVAARTYTLRNLGEFAREGYDICATPRCQVYRGTSSEHPLSDQAVAETTGEVLLHHGELVDARYSATCGGHTEDVRFVFPLEDHPYLKGVPCPEAPPVTLGGAVPGALPGALARALLPGPDGGRGGLEARLQALAEGVGLPPVRDRLGSVERREVRRYVGSVFDLALDREALLPATGATTTRGPQAAAAPRGHGPSALGVGGGTEPLSDDEADALVVSLAEQVGALERLPASFLARGEDALEVRRAGGERLSFDLASPFATFAADGTAAPLSLLPGDRIRLFLAGRRVVGVQQLLAADQAAFRRASGFAAWRRFRSDRELARRVAERYPGLGFEGLEVLDRGVSGRVGRLRLRGAGGRSLVVEGLAVRWTLDVPDTRFEVRRATGDDGHPGWLFTGSGWGHGVGLCQVGSVNLAGRGSSYREILHHYYTDVELAVLTAAPRRWVAPEPPPPRGGWAVLAEPTT